MAFRQQRKIEHLRTVQIKANLENYQVARYPYNAAILTNLILRILVNLQTIKASFITGKMQNRNKM